MAVQLYTKPRPMGLRDIFCLQRENVLVPQCIEDGHGTEHGYDAEVCPVIDWNLSITSGERSSTVGTQFFSLSLRFQFVY